MTIANQIFLNSPTVRGVVEVADPHQRRDHAHSIHQCQWNTYLRSANTTSMNEQCMNERAGKQTEHFRVTVKF